MTVSGVRSSWVMLVNTTDICSLFFVLRWFLYHSMQANTTPANIIMYSVKAHHDRYHGGNTFTLIPYGSCCQWPKLSDAFRLNVYDPGGRSLYCALCCDASP